MSAETLGWQMRSAGLRPETEYRFHPRRRWRADFAFPKQRLLIEFEGGIYTRGRHTRGKGYEKDMEKYNAATSLGYRVLRFSSKHVTSGYALKTIEEALNG